jgi:hypothetical protein
MSEKLTDEQLRDLRDCNPANPFISPMAAELLALRAERAKPTQSDEERALTMLRATEDALDADHELQLVLAAYASIRAEGSAERAKLEARPTAIVGQETIDKLRSGQAVELDAVTLIPASTFTYPAHFIAQPCRKRGDGSLLRDMSESDAEDEDWLASHAPPGKGAKP